MTSKFKISDSEKTLKVSFNWLSYDLAILVAFFAICFLSFWFFGYAILNSEKVPATFFLAYFFAFLFILYLGYATFLTLFSRTFVSIEDEDLIVKRKPFFGMENASSVPVQDIDKLVQKNYLFFYYKVVAKLKEGEDVPVFSYHYYDSSVFKNFEWRFNKLLGRETDEPISITKEQTSKAKQAKLEAQTNPIGEKEPVSDLNMYAQPEKAPAEKKKSMPVKKRKVFKIKAKTPPPPKQDYPGTQAPAPPAKKVRKKRAAAKQQKRRKSSTKEQFVPIINTDYEIDQIIYIEKVFYYIKRIFQYSFEDGTKDKVYQLVPKNNKRRFFYLQFRGDELTIHEESELNYNQTKSIDFKSSEPHQFIDHRGDNFKLLDSKSGFSESVETGNKVEIKEWLYISENGDNKQLRIVEGDKLIKIHTGVSVPSTYLTIKK